MTLAVFTSDFGGGQKQLQFQLKGNDLGALNLAAEQVMEVVRNTKGAVDIGLSTKGQKPELIVDLKRVIEEGRTDEDVAVQPDEAQRGRHGERRRHGTGLESAKAQCRGNPGEVCRAAGPSRRGHRGPARS